MRQLTWAAWSDCTLDRFELPCPNQPKDSCTKSGGQCLAQLRVGSAWSEGLSKWMVVHDLNVVGHMSCSSINVLLFSYSNQLPHAMNACKELQQH